MFTLTNYSNGVLVYIRSTYVKRFLIFSRYRLLVFCPVLMFSFAMLLYQFFFNYLVSELNWSLKFKKCCCSTNSKIELVVDLNILYLSTPLVTLSPNRQIIYCFGVISLLGLRILLTRVLLHSAGSMEQVQLRGEIDRLSSACTQ